jgi:hypothetical protein
MVFPGKINRYGRNGSSRIMARADVCGCKIERRFISYKSAEKIF